MADFPTKDNTRVKCVAAGRSFDLLGQSVYVYIKTDHILFLKRPCCAKQVPTLKQALKKTQ